MLAILFTLLKIIWFIFIIVALWNPTKKFVKWLSGITRGDVVDKISQPLMGMFQLNKLDQRFNFFYQRYANFVSDIYLLRMPIIGALILFSLPFIAQFIFPKFLQNIFVMESGIQLIIVMLFATLSSLSIVSLIKDIIVIHSIELNIYAPPEKQEQKKANLFRNLRIFGGILLVLPIWVSFKSIGLISSASGGSVGTMFYLDKLENGILQNPEEMIKNATDDWLDSVAWGLAFPDLLRLVGYPIAPLIQDGIYLDRGYSLEKDWQRNLQKDDGKTATLDDWYKKALNGEIPIPVFNSTIVENGRRFLISPMKFIPGEMKYYADPILLLPDKLAQDKKELSEEEKAVIKQSKAFDFRTLYHNCGNKAEPLKAGNKPCTIDVTTAARLSATFPYVSPMARNDINNKLIDSSDNEIKNKEGKTIIQNYHMADGGYFDNAGAFTALEWLDRLLEKDNDVLKIKKVVLIQINAFPEDILKTHEIGEKGFLTVGIGPFTALNGVRNSTQIARNIEAVKLIKNRWEKEEIKIQDFAFTFPEKNEQGKEYNQPLSWRLTKPQKNNLKDAWENDKTIIKTVECLNNFWNKDEINNECENLS